MPDLNDFDDNDSRRPSGNNFRARLISAIITLSVLAFVLFGTFRGTFTGGGDIDEIAANVFVTAVKEDRVKDVTYKTSDGSLRGTYWADREFVADKTRARRFKSF